MHHIQEDFANCDQPILGQSEDQKIVNNRLTEVLSRDSNIKDQ